MQNLCFVQEFKYLCAEIVLTGRMKTGFSCPRVLPSHASVLQVRKQCGLLRNAKVMLSCDRAKRLCFDWPARRAC